MNEDSKTVSCPVSMETSSNWHWLLNSGKVESEGTNHYEEDTSINYKGKLANRNNCFMLGYYPCTVTFCT